MPNLFVRAWKGEASLATSFWLIFFLFSLIIFFLLNIIFHMIKPGFADINVVRAIMFPYTLYSAVCVWRSGKNAWLIWSILSRVVVVLFVLAGIYFILQALRLA